MELRAFRISCQTTSHHSREPLNFHLFRSSLFVSQGSHSLHIFQESLSCPPSSSNFNPLLSRHTTIMADDADDFFDDLYAYQS